MRPVFLLSPAWCGGRRARILLRDGAASAIAQRLRAGDLTLGEAFAFLSGLYFRGKLAYACAFGRPLIITPTRGLLPPETPVSAALLREFAAVDVSASDSRYRRPLERDLGALVAETAPVARVVLLGSLATGKYVDVLIDALGERLHYPPAFVGRGDMSRGGLLLRSVAAGAELDYAPLDRGARLHGPRPPKLAPTPAARKPVRLVRVW